jgi:hypothetical protein
MAKFSQQFLANLGRPGFQESMFGLGQAIGGIPGRRQEQQKQQEVNKLLQQIQGAQGSGDFTSMKILGQQLAAIDPQQAAKVMQAATALEQKLGQQKALEGLLTGGPQTPESFTTAAKQALSAGDLEMALDLAQKGTDLETTTRQKEAKRKAAITQLQGFMQDPRVSQEDKLQVRGVLQGLVTGQTDIEAVEPQIQGFRDRFKPRAVGSRAAPVFKDLMRPNPQTGVEEKRTIRFDTDPLTGAPIEIDVGRAPPKEFAPDTIQESTALLKIEKDLTTEANQLQAQALKAEELAAGLEQYNPVGGLQGSLIEYTKQISGQQDAISALRTEASRLTTGAAVAALPKGPASDKDIALVLKGVPPATANAQYLAQYARGVAKMQKAEAEYKREQLNWLSKNRSYQGFNAHMTKKKVEEQFAATPQQAIRDMEANINDPVYLRSFIKNMGYDYVQYKRELEDATSILGGM